MASQGEDPLHARNAECVTLFREFVLNSCGERLREIGCALDDSSHYGVDVDLIRMQNEAPELASRLLLDPAGVLPLLDSAAAAAAEHLVDLHTSRGGDYGGVDDGTGERTLRMTVKQHIHARVCHLPATPRYTKQNVSVLRAGDTGKLMAVLGTVTRTGSVMLREVTRRYACGRCRGEFDVEGDISQKGAFDLPPRCPVPRKDGRGCHGSSFRPVESSPPICREYQEIKLQEKIQNLEVGSIPRSLLVVLTDDLADSVKPGDDVVASGILHRRWNKPVSPDQRCDIQLMLVALHMRRNNEQKSFVHVTEDARQQFAAHWALRPRDEQLRARDEIVRSICPQIYGMYLLKLILAMTLVGGVSYRDPSGTRIRGESHLLMVGDPGTAKSQFLRYATKVSPRAVLTTGIGTTAAGLTVTAVREPGTGDWVLDAGALVLADGGICCIDEFDGIREHDRGAIHEAMEQQTLSVAKAGLVCTLDTRATVIAAVNPKCGKLSTEIGISDGQTRPASDDRPESSLSVSVGIASPLLSRFDVVLTLLDQRNEEWDRALSSFILDGYCPPKEDTAAPAVWPVDKLQQYVAFIKSSLKPRLSSHAQRLLTKYYTLERAAARRSAARTTVRLLEALVRLTQAHARIMFREVATAMDAVFAIAAVEASAAAQQVVGGIGALHGQFPDDPDSEFREYGAYLLAKLGIDDEFEDFFSDDAAPPPSSPS